MCSKSPVEARHFSVLHIIWCSEGPCEPPNGNQFTDLDPEPLEIEYRGTDFTFYFRKLLLYTKLPVVYNDFFIFVPAITDDRIDVVRPSDILPSHWP